MRLFALLMLAVCSALAHDGPPLDLLADNMAASDVTAHVRIDQAAIDQSLRDDRGRAGYVHLRLEVTVLERFRGAAPDTLALFETVEAPAKPPAIGTELVVSFTRAPDGRYAVPDMGYAFPASREVIERARALGRSKLNAR